MSAPVTIGQTITIDSRADRESVRLAVESACASANPTLPDYITAHLGTPFQWGVHDCVCFAIGWVQIAAGTDYLGKYAPWTTEKKAQALRKRLGGLEKMFDTHLKRIPAGFAKDGDVALVGDTAYLFSGAHIVGPGKDGLVFKNRMEATCAWSY